MSGSLGERIGGGATADVHAWAPGRVVKLFKPGMPLSACVHETRVTRAIRAAGVPAPEVFDTVTIDDRCGFVMARLDGASLMDATKRGSASFAQAGSILADCLDGVHRTPPPSGLPRLRDHLLHSLGKTSHSLPPRVVAGILERAGVPSPDDRICHGDPNPGNVICSQNGPILIDWPAATLAPAAFDLASAQVLLTEIAPYIADDPDRPRGVNAALQAAYAERAGLAMSELSAWVTPYLAVVRALALLNAFVPALTDRLTRRLVADFPP